MVLLVWCEDVVPRVKKVCHIAAVATEHWQLQLLFDEAHFDVSMFSWSNATFGKVGQQFLSELYSLSLLIVFTSDHFQNCCPLCRFCCCSIGQKNAKTKSTNRHEAFSKLLLMLLLIVPLSSSSLFVLAPYHLWRAFWALIIAAVSSVAASVLTICLSLRWCLWCCRLHVSILLPPKSVICDSVRWVHPNHRSHLSPFTCPLFLSHCRSLGYCHCPSLFHPLFLLLTFLWYSLLLVVVVSDIEQFGSSVGSERCTSTVHADREKPVVRTIAKDCCCCY